MSAEDEWKLRCELAEKRAEEAEALLVVCRKLGMLIEERPAYEGFALRNLRAQDAEAEIDALKEQLEAVKKQRNAAVLTLDEVSALVDRKSANIVGQEGETVVDAVRRVLDELAKLKERA